MGKELTESPKESAIAFEVERLPPSRNRQDFERFKPKPDASWNELSTSRIAPKELWLPLNKMSISSAKLRCVTSGSRAFRCGMKCRVSAALSSSFDRMSIMITKRDDEIGSPCLSPFFLRKEPHQFSI